MANERDPRAMNPGLPPLERPLSDEERMYAHEIMDLGQQMLSTLEQLPKLRGRAVDPGSGIPPYELQCARTRVQEAVFWALQFLTQ